jgi:uncharacterized protein (TIRG00374 family)
LAFAPPAFVAGLTVLRRAPLERWTRLGGSTIRRVLEPVLAYMRDPQAPRAIAVAAVLSVLVAGVQFGVVRGLVYALGGAPLQEKWVYVGTAMAFIVGAIPALPGGWGTADAAYVFFFGLAGLSPSVALAVCLLYRSFWYATGIVGAVLHVSRGRAEGQTGKAALG